MTPPDRKHITDQETARRVAIYREALSEMPEEQQHILRYWRDQLALCLGKSTSYYFKLRNGKDTADATLAAIIMQELA